MGACGTHVGFGAVLQDLLASRRFDFPVERAIWLTVLHRLMAPGSDRAAERWRHDYAIAGTDGLELHHLYRAMAWLGEPLPTAQQAAATPFAPRTTKDLIEEALFARRRDLFSSLDLVFFDTTSLYFHGAGGTTLGRHGHSRDHRPDLKQMVVGRVLDGEGRPVCTELWPGNVTDVTTPYPRSLASVESDIPRARHLYRGRPRHDQRRHDGGARGARLVLHPRGADAKFDGGPSDRRDAGGTLSGGLPAAPARERPGPPESERDLARRPPVSRLPQRRGRAAGSAHPAPRLWRRECERSRRGTKRSWATRAIAGSLKTQGTRFAIDDTKIEIDAR